MPKDVLAQQEKVAWADGLAFIAPVHLCSFPAILKGWIDRVWTLDFAFGLTSAGWHGDINGRVPLLHHQRALIMTSTIFDKNAYDDGIRDAIGKVIDDWAFASPASRTSNTSTSTRPHPPPRTWSSDTSSRRMSSAATSKDRPWMPGTCPRQPEHLRAQVTGRRLVMCAGWPVWSPG
jgi:hypothetical protein